MPTYPELIVFARMVVMPGREYYDLVMVPGLQPIYGILDQPHAQWREQLTAETCRERLLAWPEIPTDPMNREQTSAQVTEEGRHWLQGGHMRGDEV